MWAHECEKVEHGPCVPSLFPLCRIGTEPTLRMQWRTAVGTNVPCSHICNIYIYILIGIEAMVVAP